MTEMGNANQILLLKEINTVIQVSELREHSSNWSSDGAFKENVFFILGGYIIASTYPAISFDPCPPASLYPQMVGAQTETTDGDSSILRD